MVVFNSMGMPDASTGIIMFMLFLFVICCIGVPLCTESCCVGSKVEPSPEVDLSTIPRHAREIPRLCSTTTADVPPRYSVQPLCPAFIRTPHGSPPSYRSRASIDQIV